MRARTLVIAAWFCLSIASVPVAAAAQGSQYLFPQIADGTFSGGFYVTTITVSNPWGNNNEVTLRFTSQNGTPWVVDLRSTDRADVTGKRSSLDFTLKPRESVAIYTAGVDPLAVGWASLQAKFTVVTSAVYGVFKRSGSASYLGSEAGVLPSPSVTELSFFVDISRNSPVQGTDVDTGFALVNPSGAAATITATLFAAGGSTLGTPKILNLVAGGQTAQFVSQLFSGVNLPANFHGRVQFSSNVNVAALALRQTYGASDTISTVAVVPDSSTGPATVYDREPNDSFETAQPLAVFPTEIIGTMNTPSDGADLDLFIVNMLKGDVLYVLVLADMIYSPLDDSLSIYDSQFKEVARNDALAGGLNDTFIRYVVPADGLYFILHTSAGGTSSRGAYYRMHVWFK